MAKKKTYQSLKKKFKNKIILIEWKRITVFAIFTIVILSVLALNFGLIKKNCQDDGCFNSALLSCTPAKYQVIKNNNLYNYIIQREKGEVCVLKFDLVAMAEGTDVNEVLQFEGKSMTCEVPKVYLGDINIDELKGILNYCSGELKEALYEEIITKLYGLVLVNMDDVISEIESTLNKI